MPLSVEFSGSHTSVLKKLWPPQVGYSDIGIEILGGDEISVSSGMPFWIAAARTNALNVDPAWNPAESPYRLGTT